MEVSQINEEFELYQKELEIREQRLKLNVKFDDDVDKILGVLKETTILETK